MQRAARKDCVLAVIQTLYKAKEELKNKVLVYICYLMVVVDESLPTAILCSPSLICWAQYGCSHAT